MKLTLYVFILSMFACCGKMDEPAPAQSSAKEPEIIVKDSSTLTINCFAGMQESRTRAAVDYILTDVNIYLYCSQYGISKHYYRSVSGTGALNIKLVNGTYNIFVIGNYGSNMGEKSLAQVSALACTVSSEMDIIGNGSRMAMRGNRIVTIKENSTVSIPLERLSAKVTFNVSMAPAMSDDSRIIHLQLYNCNGRVAYFSSSHMTGISNGGIASYPKLNLSGQNLKAVSRGWYLMENRQGNVSGITSPRQRSKAKAPAYATYLWLRIERNGKYIDYRIYLGENDTNNFDVMRNTNYVYNIVVAGESAADLRVSTVTMKFYSAEQPAGGPSYSPFDRFVWKDKTAYCMLHISTTNQDPTNIFSVSFAHQSGTFRAGWYVSYSCPYVTPQQYRQMREGNSYPVFKGTGTSTIYFSFWNGDSAALTHNNIFLFGVTDSYGYNKQFTITTATLPQ